MAAGYDGSIRIDTKINSNGFNAGIKSMLGLLSKLGAAVGVAFGAAALVNFGKQAIDIASDIEEVQNVVNTAFGSMSGMVDEFAKTCIQKFGMSELSAKRTASTYMAMNKGMGLYTKEAAQMAIDAAARTGDIASFYNMSQEEADTMMKSIWTGETESLKRIGVVMTQTNLDSFALANGFSKTTKEMTQQEQVLLRYKYVMQQTGLAAGDFEKTQDSWANQTRILSESWKQFLGNMGQGLIQVLTPALKFLNQVVAALNVLAQKFSALTASLFGKQDNSAAQQQAIADGTNNAANAQDNLAQATKKTTKEAKGALAAFDQINVLQESKSSAGSADTPNASAVNMSVPMQIPTDVKVNPELNGAIESVKESLGKVWSALLPSFSSAQAKIIEQLGKLKQVFSRAWADIKTLSKPLEEWFQGDFVVFLSTCIASIGNTLSGLLEVFTIVFGSLWNTVIFPALQVFTTTVLPVVTQALTELQRTWDTVFNAIETVFLAVWTGFIEPALTTGMKIWSDLWGTIKNAWDKWGKTTFDNIRTAIDNIKTTFMTVWENFLAPLWQDIMDMVDWLWTKHLKPLVENIVDFVGELVNCALNIYNKFISPIVNWLVKTLGPTVKNVLSTIGNIFGTVFGVISDLISGLIRALKGIVQFIAGVFTGDWKKAWEGIKNIFGGIVDGMKGIFKGVGNFFIDIINGMLQCIETGVNKIIGCLNKIHFDIPDWIPGIGGQTWGFNFKSVKLPQIPKLAQGAIIPPNAEFMAVLGDQKHGRNLEAPENLIRKIVREETASKTPTDINIRFTGSMAQLVRALKPEIERQNRVQGKNMLKGAGLA